MVPFKIECNTVTVQMHTSILFAPYHSNNGSHNISDMKTKHEESKSIYFTLLTQPDLYKHNIYMSHKNV